MDLSMPAGTPAPLTPLQRLTALYVAGGYGRQSEHFAADLLADHDAAKDTRKGASTLSSDVIDLLTAIHQALDVPLPGLTDADERAYHRLMERRMSNVRTSLGPILHDPSIGLLNTDAGGIRKGTVNNPVTYTEWAGLESPAGGGERP